MVMNLPSPLCPRAFDFIICKRYIFHCLIPKFQWCVPLLWPQVRWHNYLPSMTWRNMRGMRKSSLCDFRGQWRQGVKGWVLPPWYHWRRREGKKTIPKKKNSLNKLQKSLNRMPLERSITHCYHVISHKHTSTVGNQDSPPCGNYIQKELWPAPSQPNSFLHIDLFKREK